MVNLQIQQQQVTGAGGKASFGNDAAIVTTESLSTGAGLTLTYTLFSPQITSKSLVDVAIANGTNSAGTPALATITPADNGSCAIVIQNIAAAGAFNGTLKMSVVVFN